MGRKSVSALKRKMHFVIRAWLEEAVIRCNGSSFFMLYQHPTIFLATLNVTADHICDITFSRRVSGQTHISAKLFFCSFLCAFYKLFVIHLTQSVDQFFADLQLIFSIGLDDDIGSCLVFFSTFFHQFRNE